MEYNDLTKQTIQDGLQNSSQVNDGRDHFTRTRNNERSLPYDLVKTMVRKTASLEETNIVSDQTNIED